MHTYALYMSYVWWVHVCRIKLQYDMCMYMYSHCRYKYKYDCTCKNSLVCVQYMYTVRELKEICKKFRGFDVHVQCMLYIVHLTCRASLATASVMRRVSPPSSPSRGQPARSEGDGRERGHLLPLHDWGAVPAEPRPHLPAPLPPRPAHSPGYLGGRWDSHRALHHWWKVKCKQ